MTEKAKVEGVLDPAALENLREMMGGDAELSELIDTFLEDAPQLLADMHQAVEQGDAAGLRLAAHSLKSNSADFGAMALSNLCRELEGMGKAGKLDGAAGLVRQAAAEYEQVKAALEAVYSG
jgi:HPt (histidine-containing phosphotransfer) domain-containing protein